jgi:hypothetical protein
MIKDLSNKIRANKAGSYVYHKCPNLFFQRSSWFEWELGYRIVHLLESKTRYIYSQYHD